MPAPRHVRITFSGTLGTDSPAPEIWSFGLAATPGNLASPDDVINQQTMQGVADVLGAAWTAIAPGIQQSARLKRIRCAVIKADGKTALTPGGRYVHGDNTTDQPGTGAGAFPFQVALAVRLQSGQVGPVGRGRFFLPVPAATCDPADGLVGVMRRDELANMADGLVEAVQTRVAAGWGGRVCIASGGSPTLGLAPALYPVESVQVGRALDTMRSRRNALEESYAIRPLTPP